MVKKKTLNVPRMYADHHTKAVKAVLAELDGVQDVIASSARKTVTVIFDEASLTDENIEQHLTSAGYGPADQPTTPEHLPKMPERCQVTA